MTVPHAAGQAAAALGLVDGYGFASSGSPDLPEEEHRRSIRGFLDMIDPATGHIAED